MSFAESMCELEAYEIDEVSGGGYFSSFAGALSGVLWAGSAVAEGAGVVVLGVALAPELAFGAAILAGAAGVAYLTGN